MKIEFKEPWEDIEPDNEFHLELEKEIIKGHIFFGIKTRAIARRTDCDDFLFELLDGSGRLAVVHLTWQKETDPQWPWAEIYRDLGEWKEKRMEPDIAEWNEFN